MGPPPSCFKQRRGGSPFKLDACMSKIPPKTAARSRGFLSSRRRRRKEGKKEGGGMADGEESAALFAFSRIKITGDGRGRRRRRRLRLPSECRAEARWQRSGWSTTAVAVSVISPLPLPSPLRYYCRFSVKQITRRERRRTSERYAKQGRK